MFCIVVWLCSYIAIIASVITQASIKTGPIENCFLRPWKISRKIFDALQETKLRDILRARLHPASFLQNHRKIAMLTWLYNLEPFFSSACVGKWIAKCYSYTISCILT